MGDKVGLQKMGGSVSIERPSKLFTLSEGDDVNVWVGNQVGVAFGRKTEKE
jgi:hypothetical protein